MLFAAIGNTVDDTDRPSIAWYSPSAPDGSALPGGFRIVGRLHRVHLAAEACSTQKVATYAYVNPIVAVFLGWLVLHERFDGYIFAGSVVVIAAVVGHHRKSSLAANRAAIGKACPKWSRRSDKS